MIALAAGCALLALSWGWTQLRAWPPSGGALVPAWWGLALSALLMIAPGMLLAGDELATVATWWWLATGLVAPVVAWRVDRRRQSWIRRADAGEAIRDALQGQPDSRPPRPEEPTSDDGLIQILHHARRLTSSQRLVRAVWDAPILVSLVSRDGVVLDQWGEPLRHLPGLTDQGWRDRPVTPGGAVATALEEVLEGHVVPYEIEWGGRRFRGVGAPWREADPDGVHVRGGIFVAVDWTDAREVPHA